MIWIFLFALLALGYQAWAWQQTARGQAMAAVKRRCQQEGVQLLDDTLVLERMRLRRGKRGMVLWRCYQFEFTSTGDQRYRGHVALSGRKLETIEMAAYRTPDPMQ